MSNVDSFIGGLSIGVFITTLLYLTILGVTFNVTSLSSIKKQIVQQECGQYNVNDGNFNIVNLRKKGKIK